MGGTNPACFKTGRFFFSQHRRGTVEPDAAARNRDDVARPIRTAKYHSLDQIHRNRRSKKRVAVARPFQTDQLATLSQRLPRICFSFYEVRSRRTKSACAWRSVSGQEQHRTLVAHARERSSLSWQYVVRALRDHSEPGQGATAPCDVSGPVSGVVSKAA